MCDAIPPMKISQGSAPVVESLEPRLAPAGVVMLSLANGVLTVGGDTSDNDLQITDSGGGTWTIGPTVGGTTQFRLNGGPALPAVTFAAPLSVRATLGAGNDTMDLLSVDVTGAFTAYGNDGDDSFLLSGVAVGGAVLMDSGAGADEIDFTTSDFAGTVTVRMGTGGDYFTAGGDLFFNRGFSVDLGTGANTFDINAESLQSNGSISAVAAGTAVETQAFLLATGNGGVAGNVTLRTASSSPTYVDIGDVAGDSLSVQGGLTIVTGGGNDQVLIDRNLTVGGALNLSLGSGFNQVTTPDLASLTAGALTFTGGTGRDEVSIGGATVAVTGNVTMNAGSGDNFLDLYQTTSLRVGGGVTYLGSIHSDDLIIDGADVAIGGRVTFYGSHGTNSLGFNAVVGSAGSLVYNGGAGSDVADVGQFEGDSTLITVFGNVSITTGAGSSEVTVRDASIYGSLTVSTAAGWGYVDTVQVLESDVGLNTYINLIGWAESDVVVRDSTFGGAFTAATGGGDDYVMLDTDSDGSSMYSEFNGPVRIYLGAGNDIIAAGKAPTVATVGADFNDIVYLDGGTGYDYGYLVHPDYNNQFFGGDPYGRNMEVVY